MDDATNSHLLAGQQQKIVQQQSFDDFAAKSNANCHGGGGCKCCCAGCDCGCRDRCPKFRGIMWRRFQEAQSEIPVRRDD